MDCFRSRHRSVHRLSWITEARECDCPDHRPGTVAQSLAKYWLGPYLVYPNFGVLILVMRDGEIVAIQLREKNARFGAEGSWNLRQQSVMIGIFLLENVQSAVAGQIKALMLGVVTHVIDHAYRRQAGDDFAAVRVKDNQLSRISGGHKQTVVRFVKSHGHIQFIARRQRPSCRDFRLVPVDDPDHALA